MKEEFNNPQDNNRFSLTGNEFLDYLSWCDVMGIDFEGKEEVQEEQEEIDDSQPIYRLKKGRDKYE